MKKRKYIFGLVLFLLAACSGAGSGTPATEVASPVAAEALNTEASESNSETSSTVTEAGCTETEGQIEELEIESEYLSGNFRFRVYTPPCYAQQEESRFPVLYMLHGQTFNDDQWDRIGADEAANALIAAGEVAPFIIVMPYDHNSLRPSVGFLDEVLIDELLPWIDANYRTIPEREYRAIGGLSRGASWALHFGAVNYELFGAMGGHSPPIFPEDAGRMGIWLKDISEAQRPRIWLDIGESDLENILDSAVWFHELLDQLDISHEWQLIPGNHTEDYWSSHVEEYLRWYAAPW
jgi:enterochelin esterase-like enzyme